VPQADQLGRELIEPIERALPPLELGADEYVVKPFVSAS